MSVKSSFIYFICSLFLLPLTMQAAYKESSNIKIVYTTDVHGCIFPTDYVTMKTMSGSLARVASAVDSLREMYGEDEIILLDNGDMLQGQPTVYYYNYINTDNRHIVNDIYELMKYDAVTLGNHDIETGHAVYDRIKSSMPVPVLAANVIDETTGEPYFKPYVIIERNGIKVAVLGLITPAIPAWLPRNLWSGLKFEPMIESAQNWIEVIKAKEMPDVIIGLFHSGYDSSKSTGEYIENASALVAENVIGFDAILMGHDHQRHLSQIQNIAGETVHLLNPANNAQAVGIVNVKLRRDSVSGKIEKQIYSEIADVDYFKPSTNLLEKLSDADTSVREFVTRKIGKANGNFFSGDAFFGCSAFMSLLHRMQLAISGADISFAAPLSFNAKINAGDLHISDMFTLYKYENMLYTMELSGQEIKDYLEESYSLWIRDFDGDKKHIIYFASDNPTPGDNRLKYPAYNFDSAAGINYTVDITKPKGERISITTLSSGEAFDIAKKYTVAVNSYRGNGGGDLLTKGAGIPQDKLSDRIIKSTDKDLRYYLLKQIESDGVIEADIDCNWRFIPEELVRDAIETDRALLFGPNSSVIQK